MEANKMLIVGLTGQTGAGKSTLGRMFSERGIQIVDADMVARETMENSKECRMDLVLEFSTEVIRPDASLNREKLAKICFSDKKKLSRLNQIAYPYIIREISKRLGRIRSNGAIMAILDAPTLYEAGLEACCDRTIAVLAKEETRLRRIMSRDSMVEEDARLRVNAQHKDKFYEERTKYILRNDDDLDTLRISFMELYQKLEVLAKEKVGKTPVDILHIEADVEMSGDFEELTEVQEAE